MKKRDAEKQIQDIYDGRKTPRHQNDEAGVLSTAQMPISYQIHNLVMRELDKAEAKHCWKETNLIKQGLILSEESGEVSQAILNYDEGKGSLADIRKELLQTAAMCYRILKNLPK